MIRTSLAAGALVAVALAGCSSGSKAGTSGPTCDKACQVSSIEAELSSSASAPANGLTGFGASLDSWNAHHDADADPKLNPNCCYGPRIRFFGSSGTTDTWVAVLSDGGTIYSLDHNFEPNTSRADALAAVVSQDLPSDAVEVTSKVGDGCEMFVYKSDAFEAADPTHGPYMDFFFVSPPDESVYYPDNIWFAGVMGYEPTTGDC